MAIKSLSIRIDDKMLNKLHVVADYEGRSANSQILILIRNLIEKYEKEHGVIVLNTDDKKDKSVKLYSFYLLFLINMI